MSLNPVIDLIQNRSSVRQFKDAPLKQDDIETILDAAQRAPSAGNFQNYAIITVEKKETQTEFDRLHYNNLFSQSALNLVFCSDTRRNTRWLKSHNQGFAFDSFVGYLLGIVDASLAMSHAILGAESIGIGSCVSAIGTSFMKDVSKALDCPAGVYPVCVLALGYPLEKPKCSPRLPKQSVVHRERYRDQSFDQLRETYKNCESITSLHFPAVSLYLKELMGLGIESTAQAIGEKVYPKKQGESCSATLFEHLKSCGVFGHNQTGVAQESGV